AGRDAICPAARDPALRAGHAARVAALRTRAAAASAAAAGTVRPRDRDRRAARARHHAFLAPRAARPDTGRGALRAPEPVRGGRIHGTAAAGLSRARLRPHAAAAAPRSRGARAPARVVGDADAADRGGDRAAVRAPGARAAAPPAAVRPGTRDHDGAEAR